MTSTAFSLAHWEAKYKWAFTPQTTRHKRKRFQRSWISWTSQR